MDSLVPVTLHFRDGRVARVLLPGGTALGAAVSVVDEHGETAEIPIGVLKGIFYLKDPRERILEVDLGVRPAPDGTLATVEFEDGEVLSGYVNSFDVRQPGFFLQPDNPHGNNAKVYVVTAAVRSLELRP